MPRLSEHLKRLEAESIADAEEGFRLAPMAVRVSPYLLSLIDWERPYDEVRETIKGTLLQEEQNKVLQDWVEETKTKYEVVDGKPTGEKTPGTVELDNGRIIRKRQENGS